MLGFWPGNKPNRTEPQDKNRTAGGLPGPVSNTTQRVQGSVRAISGIQDTQVFLTETRVVADEQQQHHQPHQHHHHWACEISRCKYNCTGCDIACRLGIVSVNGLMISFVLFFSRFRRYIVIVVNVIDLMVSWSVISNGWIHNRDDVLPSHDGWTAT